MDTLTLVTGNKLFQFNFICFIQIPMFYNLFNLKDLQWNEFEDLASNPNLDRIDHFSCQEYADGLFTLILHLLLSNDAIFLTGPYPHELVVDWDFLNQIIFRVRYPSPSAVILPFKQAFGSNYVWVADRFIFCSFEKISRTCPRPHYLSLVGNIISNLPPFGCVTSAYLRYISPNIKYRPTAFIEQLPTHLYPSNFWHLPPYVLRTMCDYLHNMSHIVRFPVYLQNFPTLVDYLHEASQYYNALLQSPPQTRSPSPINSLQPEKNQDRDWDMWD